MPRANRYFMPGYVWHITHRCHKQDFLLKFKRDRETWVRWVYEAKKRFNLTVLNYCVTSNHIHLLDQRNNREDIPRSMHLIAGRTAQAYNIRKSRKGGYWEDRYHATAVQTGDHLLRCMIYIDLNMVRNGVVKHPSEWSEGGYHEIYKPRSRFKILNQGALLSHLEYDNQELLRDNYTKYLNETLVQDKIERESKWTESVAVGEMSFVNKVKEELAPKKRKLDISQSSDDTWELQVREDEDFYGVENLIFDWNSFR